MDHQTRQVSDEMNASFEKLDININMGSINAEGAPSGQQPAKAKFGKEMLSHFGLDPAYRNMNHGSFGLTPKAIIQKRRDYQDQTEARPDQFIRYTGLDVLDESREAVAKILKAPTGTVIFAPNATTALNIVMRELTFSPSGTDEILYFTTIYGACGKTVSYIVDTHPGQVSSRAIPLTYPLSDEDVIQLFRDAVSQSRADGKTPKICIFDTVSSLPGVRFPFEEMTRTCRELGVLSLVDGAQGIGMIPIDLSPGGGFDPDFFLSNCHKWLHVPRGCAVLYVPLRNQDMIRSSLPTSHGYVPLSGEWYNPLPPGAEDKSRFVKNFEFSGTIDNSQYFVVKDAIEWRQEVLGGEESVMGYCMDLAQRGGKKVAEILGTEVLENEEGTLGRCAMTNVRLPIEVGEGEGMVKREDVPKVGEWMVRELRETYHTFLPVWFFQGAIWVRISAQVYLEMEDFEWTGKTLLELANRVQQGAYKIVQ